MEGNTLLDISLARFKGFFPDSPRVSYGDDFYVMDIKLYVTVKYAVFGAEAEAADVHIHHQGYIPCDFIDHSHLVKTV